MPKLLEGKRALVLGVANKWSIAWAIAQAYVREGAEVILTYQGERLQRAAQELSQELAPGTKVLQCDVGKDDDIIALFEQIKDRPLDAMVHSIAFASRDDLSRPFVETSRAGFSLTHDISAYSLLALSRHAAPLMTNGGSILALSYLGAVRVIPNYNVMGVAKAALEATVRYLASDLGPSNIRVNAISAGAIKTASARGIKDFSKMLDGVAANSPLRRNTDPAEVADTAVFLSSHLGRGVTGNVVYVDAGFQVMGLPVLGA